MTAVAKSLWWYLIVAFQFVFLAPSLYRRVYVHGRSIPNKAEHRGRYIWESRGKGPDYCFRLFLGQACFVFAVMLLLPPGIPENLGMASVVVLVATNCCGYLHEKQRWKRTNQEIGAAEREMSERVEEFQKNTDKTQY